MKAFKARSLLLIPLLLLTLLLVPTVYASPPSPVSGTFTETSSTTTDFKEAGGNTFITETGIFELGGDVSGSCVQDVRILTHGSGQITAQGVATCDVTIDGKSGTMVLRTVLTGDAATGTGEGHFTIVSGTGGLENLHGQGTFQGLASGTYEGQIHFDP